MKDSLAAKLETVFLDCLFTKEELEQCELIEVMDNISQKKGQVPRGAVLVDGVRASFGFHGGRLKSHQKQVEEFIREVVHPDFFRDSSNPNGGASFLSLCMTPKGTQWGEHRNMEQLCALGIGLELAGWLLPRSFWHVLPGGMPYVWFYPPQKETRDVRQDSTAATET